MKPLDPARFELAVTTLVCLMFIRSRAAHMEELITQALVDVWRMPQFARYRQTQTQPQPGGINNLITLDARLVCLRRAGAKRVREPLRQS
jgi:hypothetical protein